jgi:hypothetical protein
VISVPSIFFFLTDLMYVLHLHPSPRIWSLNAFNHSDWAPPLGMAGILTVLVPVEELTGHFLSLTAMQVWRLS